MRKFTFIFIIMSAIVALLSCQNKQERDNDKIVKLEKAIQSDTSGFNKAKATELRNAYLDYVNAWPKDTIGASFLYKAGELSMSLHESMKAIELFQRYSKAWPEKPKAADCLFLIGFIYENDLGNYNQASNAYNEFIKKYPDHPFADDARILIQNLGKTPEELIREFEANNSNKE